jgi:DNA-binding NarL/FixJ family response regulator
VSARVVLVDDDAFVRTALAAALSDSGLDVVGQAADGLEGVARSLELSPDAVLLDIRMPRLDGVEAARRIRAGLPAARIVVFSAYDDDQLRRESIRAGADDFVVKGSTLDELVIALS